MAKRVCFSKIMDFYEPETQIGKGSSARVTFIHIVKVLKIRDRKSSGTYAAKAIEKAFIKKSLGGFVKK